MLPLEAKKKKLDLRGIQNCNHSKNIQQHPFGTFEDLCSNSHQKKQ